jgi:hypothetical protein
VQCGESVVNTPPPKWGGRPPPPHRGEALRTTGGAWAPIAARRLAGVGGSRRELWLEAVAGRVPCEATCDDSSNDWRERSEQWQT